ncbi:hypothetical protein FD38_GL000734 [Levilactobacillus zymae DSM 19395]|nr:hypothetical protein FD38_GL000734 [Levilactobacillus zymae DSM 19395]
MPHENQVQSNQVIRMLAKLTSLLKAYLKGLFPLSLILLFTARTVGLAVHLDWTAFDTYFLIAVLGFYPVVAPLEKRYTPHLANQTPRQLVTKLHGADIVNADQGSLWRVAHTKATLLPFDDNPLADLLNFVCRQLVRILLILLAPLLASAIWWRHAHRSR